MRPMHDCSSPVSSRAPQPGLGSIRAWALALVVTTAIVLASYFWFDRPIALFIDAFHFGLAKRPEVRTVANIPNPLLLVAEVALFVLGLSACAKLRLARWQRVGLVCA